jgi:predicted transcriptional regulator
MINKKSNEYKVLNEMRKKPFVSRSEILENLSMSETTIAYTLHKLAGLFDAVKDELTKTKGRKKHLYFLTKAGDLQLQATDELYE